MAESRNILTLIESGREEEALVLLTKSVRQTAATGPRSSRAALEVATRLYGGDVVATAWFMNRQHRWLRGQTPIERAEESDEGLEFVIDMIGAIEAGVYI